MTVDLLGLPSMQVIELTEGVGDRKGTLIVKVRLTVETSGCTHCGATNFHGHGVVPQIVADTPLRTKPTTLVVERKRFRCLECGKTFTEAAPDLHPTRQATKRLVEFVEQNGQRLSMAEVARQTGIDNKSVRKIVDDYRATTEKLRMPVTPRVLGLDEAMITGTYRAVITNVETRDFFDILEGRTRKDLDPYFSVLPDKHKVEAVVTDLWNHYRLTIAHHFPNVPLIADRFHVMRMASTAMEDVRKSVRQTLKGKQHEAERIKLKDRRFLLLGRQDELDANKLALLAEIKAQYPLLAAAHDAKEGFFAFYDEPNRKAAEASFALWRTSIDPQVERWFRKVANCVDDWHKQVFVYFDLRFTNAYTESFNRFIKDTNRFGRGYGFPVLRSRLLFNNIAKHIEWPKIRPHDKGQKTAPGPVSAPAVGAGRWGFTDAFMASSVSSARAVEAPTTEEPGEARKYLWYGASIPIICDLLEQGYFE